MQLKVGTNKWEAIDIIDMAPAGQLPVSISVMLNCEPVQATCAWWEVADGPDGQQLQPASCPCTDSLFFHAPPIF